MITNFPPYDDLNGLTGRLNSLVNELEEGAWLFFSTYWQDDIPDEDMKLMAIIGKVRQKVISAIVLKECHLESLAQTVRAAQEQEVVQGEVPIMQER